MVSSFIDLKLRALREADVFLRRFGNEIHLHIGPARIVTSSPAQWTYGARDLLAEAAALDKVAELAARNAAELRERAAETGKREAS